jgi:hypothetical protein
MMTVGRMNWQWAFLASAAISLAACSSSSDKNSAPGSGAPTDAASFGQMLKLSESDVSGWQQQTATTESGPTYEAFPADEMMQKIDGQAPDYTSRGCEYVMYENMQDSNEHLCKVVAMYFGTADKAKAMYDYEKDRLGSSAIEIPQYDSSTAFGYSVLRGITGYAHLKASYFELQMDGYDDDASASQAASQVLKGLEAKAR